MIRQAVGAIVVHKGRILLVRKVKIKNFASGPKRIQGEWDFPKGGIRAGESPEKAVLRELREETGSERFRILKKYEQRIKFEFPKELHASLGFTRQETHMFRLSYDGEPEDLSPQDDEIEEVRFFSREDALKLLAHDESVQFLRNYALKGGG